MADHLKAALVQLNVGPDIAANLGTTVDYIREAAGRGAQFILTPENTCHIRHPATEKLKSAPEEKNHPVIAAFSDLARDLGVWILAGSISVRLPGEEKIANRSLIFDAKGNIVAKYDKIHLFDVDLPTGEKHRESALFSVGQQAVVVQTPWRPVGLTICYDLRFAYLFRALAQKGAGILTVPAAFTVPTGQAHWHVLLRARAIETGSYVLAPAQVGEHEGGRKTYGHSLVVNPWGEIIAEADGENPDVIVADLDLPMIEKTRTAIPALRHDRAFSGP